MTEYAKRELLCYWLATTPGITTVRFLAALARFSEPDELFSEPELIARDDDAATGAFIRELKLRANESRLRGELFELSRKGISVCTYLSADYPAAFSELDSPPMLLYIKGDIKRLTPHRITVIGTRDPSEAGIANTRYIASELALNDVTVVSGMAKGIDGVANAAALDAGGATVAILGTGIDKPYPQKNTGLYNQIAEKGVLMSEYPPGMPAYPANFPYRNRLLVALSAGVLVCEGREQSGSAISAHLALEQGRELFAMPGDINRPQSELPNRLIRIGSATLITTAGDILDAFGWNVRRRREAARPRKESPHLSKLDFLQSTIYNLLVQGDRTTQQLYDGLDATVSEVSAALTMLELYGLIRRLPGDVLTLA